MEGWQIALACVGAGLLLFLLSWLFLIAPRARKKAIGPFLTTYAHRGAWGEGIPENSLAAFRRAAELGFAIELDVQLSSDGEVMVFHDYTLDRMCGVEGKLAYLDAAALGKLALGESDQCIPTLREVLEVVAGRVPLLIELKGESTDTSLVAPLLALLAGYKGEWCVESFNPMLLAAVKKQAPQVVRGLLVSDLIKDKKNGSRLLNFALSAMLLNFLCRPAFIAWNEKYPRSLSRFVAIRLFGAASLNYTVRDEGDYHRHLAAGTYPIFEGFVPEK